MGTFFKFLKVFLKKKLMSIQYELNEHSVDIELQTIFSMFNNFTILISR